MPQESRHPSQTCALLRYSELWPALFPADWIAVMLGLGHCFVLWANTLSRRAKYTFVKQVKLWPGQSAELLPIHQPVAASAENDAAKQATGAEASAATAAEVKIIVPGIIVHEAPASSHEIAAASVGTLNTARAA